jgi:DNA polymerase-3 subunit delta
MAKQSNQDFSDAVMQIRKGIVKPIYFLSGEEPFYIDALTKVLSDSLLNEMEKEFNYTVLYGKDSNADKILGAAKQYPVMSERSVVVVREAASLNIDEIEKMHDYFNKPLESTCLVIAYRGKKADGRKAFVKTLKSKGYFFESSKLYDNAIPDFLARQFKKEKLEIDRECIQLLANHLGTDLSLHTNAIGKLKAYLGENGTVTKATIEAQIGVNRDYNVFELIRAISYKQNEKVINIFSYLGRHGKNQPPVVVIGQLFSFFSKLMTYHYQGDKSEYNIASKLKISPFFVKDYHAAAKNFSAASVLKITSKLRDYDLKSKGKNAGSITDEDLYKELGFLILHM